MDFRNIIPCCKVIRFTIIFRFLFPASYFLRSKINEELPAFTCCCLPFKLPLITTDGSLYCRELFYSFHYTFETGAWPRAVLKYFTTKTLRIFPGKNKKNKGFLCVLSAFVVNSFFRSGSSRLVFNS